MNFPVVGSADELGPKSRVTLLVSSIIDRTLELYAIAKRRKKTDIVIKALRTFLERQRINPDRDQSDRVYGLLTGSQLDPEDEGERVPEPEWASLPPQSERTRITLMMSTALDRNIELYAIASGRKKTEVVLTALSEFLKDEGIQLEQGQASYVLRLLTAGGL